MNSPFPSAERTRGPRPGQARADPTQAPPADTPSPRLALVSILAFWSVYFILATARAALTDLPAQDEMLIRRIVVTLVAMGLTGLLYGLLGRFVQARTAKLLTIAFAASVPLALAYSTVNYIAFYGFPIEAHAEMAIEHPEKLPETPLHIIVSTALEWYFFIAAWAVMWVALTYAAKVREAERRAAHYARAAQEAELRALRYQVNPHFLFNTLNSLSSLVMRERAEEAERMILNLSTFFRASLTRDASENIPLAEEIRLQLLYLEIEKVRFPERLIVKVKVPQSLEDALVPALILQPLVENAIKYGVSRSSRPVTVTVAADRVGERLELWVRDDGEAPSPNGIGDLRPEPMAACASGCGVGLANVAQRLAASYGDAADCVAGAPAAGGWLVRLSLPLVRAHPMSGDETSRPTTASAPPTP